MANLINLKMIKDISEINTRNPLDWTIDTFLTRFVDAKLFIVSFNNISLGEVSNIFMTKSGTIQIFWFLVIQTIVFKKNLNKIELNTTNWICNIQDSGDMLLFNRRGDDSHLPNSPKLKNHTYIIQR